MALSGDLTRKLITIVLERGQKIGLDVAGGFLEPAWPLVRPLVEEGLAEERAADPGDEGVRRHDIGRIEARVAQPSTTRRDARLLRAGTPLRTAAGSRTN